jgi:L-malate glycosyltransferase
LDTVNVLQLNSYFIANKLHQKLTSTMLSKNVQQTIYIPIKSKELENRNIVETDQLEFHYDYILRKYDRFLYKGKIKKQLKRIEEKVPEIKKFDLIHAHTLFSDGGTAYLLNQKNGLNYVVSVRSADIYAFYKYAVFHRPFIHKVLQNAASVVFISHAYKKQTFDLLPKNVVKAIEHKTKVIPNGIDDKWFETTIVQRNNNNKPLRLLFTGSLDKNKNLSTVLKLVHSLKFDDGKEVFLNVAGDGPLREQLITECNQLRLQEMVYFHGNVPIEKLRTLADESDLFILPSYKETFGISYVEAMSRGLPIIYTRGEGIDGFFPDGVVGYSTNPDDPYEMSENIDLILKNYTKMSNNCILESKRFNWHDIATEYRELYEFVKETVK